MNTFARLAALAAVALGALAAAPSAAAPAADAFPTRPVTLVVPFPPGGATDVLARLMAERLGQRWGQPVVVENRPGGNTVIGTDAVARSKPDGHTLGIVTVSHIINPLITDSLPYDTLRDLRGVTQLTRFHMALYANPAFPANTPDELVAMARKESGKVAYGSATTASYLGMALLGMMGGFDMEYVPYKGSAQALTDLIAGHIPLAIDPVLVSTLQHVAAGRLKIIGTMGSQPAELTPGVPLMREAVPNYDFSGMFGLVAQAGTPPELVSRIRDDVVAVMQLPEVAKQIREIGQEAVGSTPEAYDAVIREEMEKWRPVVKATGVKL